VTIEDIHAYVANLDLGLQVVDISNPASPIIVGSGNTPGAAVAVAVVGGLAYVADHFGGLQILPAQCPAPTAVEISSFEATRSPEGVLLSWTTAGEVDHLGFHVHRSKAAEGDYARVTSELIQPPGPYRFLDSDVAPGTTYFYRLEVVDRSGGNQFYGPVEATTLATAASPRYLLSQNHPNPFVAEQGATAIGFVLGQQGPAKLRIFDATGRLVRLLVDEPLSAGPHLARWDGRNDGGSPVGSGTYFYRLEAGAFSETRTLVRVR
jgi:hypothetical protein